MIELRRYQLQQKSIWDQLVTQASNQHFMFLRDYMDYHKDRFIDASFIIYRGEKAIGVLPGCQQGRQWLSHGGLTFGGVLLHHKYNRVALIQQVYDALFCELLACGYQSAMIKPLPSIYHQHPCEAEIYAVKHNLKVQCQSRLEITTTLDLLELWSPSKLRVRQQKSALKQRLVVEESQELAGFYQILTGRLQDKYGTSPVHSFAELTLLMSRFPENIKLFTVRYPSPEKADDNQVVAGCIVYITGKVWHSQYVAASNWGMDNGALDLLFMRLIEQAKQAQARYFDFGISTEGEGTYLNHSLAQFKEGFGARALLHHKLALHLVTKEEVSCEE